jgi:hypothetical protein
LTFMSNKCMFDICPLESPICSQGINVMQDLPLN